MKRLIDRIASVDNPVSRTADRLARKFLPGVAASGSCYYRCTGQGCYDTSHHFGGRYSCEYCSGGYWTGNCYCTIYC